jgi:hypothetical protein
MDKYELVKDIGAGNFGVARLMRVKNSKELVAMKYIERGPKVLLLTLKLLPFTCAILQVGVFFCFVYLGFLLL